jgi:hypothetical protein
MTAETRTSSLQKRQYEGLWLAVPRGSRQPNEPCECNLAGRNLQKGEQDEN